MEIGRYLKQDIIFNLNFMKHQYDNMVIDADIDNKATNVLWVGVGELIDNFWILRIW